LSIYRVHFKWKDKELSLKAKSLDLTHPYFVSIKGILFPEEKKLIIDPTEDEVRKIFGEADHLMIPFQTVSLIEELTDVEPFDFGKSKVMPFSIVEEKKDGADDNPDEPDKE